MKKANREIKNSKCFLISFCAVCGVLAIAFVVNILFKWKTDGIFSAEWKPGDGLNYVGAMIGSVSTFVLSLVAYWQNEKLKEMENNNYIASNSCMVLIDEIVIKPKVSIPTSYKLYEDQILKEIGNQEEVPAGYRVEVKLKKMDQCAQATPSLIYISDGRLLVGGGQKDALESSLTLKNERDGYTRVAIFGSEEPSIKFNCLLLVSKKDRDSFENAIKAEKNKLIVEFNFNVITDKYVMTKCKCRAHCNYSNDCGTITWKSNNPMVFFYGHELKKANEIKVLEV